MSFKIKSFVKSVWTTSWKFFVFLLIWAILQAPFVIFVYRILPAGRFPVPFTRLFLETMIAIAIVTATWIMVRWIDRRSWNTAGFAPVRIISDLATGFATGAGLITMSVALLWIIGSIRIASGFAISLPVLLVTGTAILFNSITQEVLLRGYLFQTVQMQGGAKLALVVTSLAFSLLHGINAVLPAINLFLAGILLGLGYMRSGNLWFPIALHFGWNFLLGPVLGLTVSGQALDCGWRIVHLQGIDMLTGGSFGLEGGLAATFSTIIGIMIVRLLFQRWAS